MPQKPKHCGHVVAAERGTLPDLVHGASERSTLPVLVQGATDRRRRATAPELHDLPVAHAERAQSSTVALHHTRSAKELTVSRTDEEDELVVEKSSFNLGVLTYRAVLCGEPMRRGVHRAEFTLISGIAGVVVGVGRERLDPLTTHSILHTDDGWGLDVLNGDLVHGPGIDVQHTSWVGQRRDRKLDQDTDIYRRACEGDRISLELDINHGSLTVYRNDIFLGVLVRKGLRVKNNGARDAGEGLMWVVELARKGQAVRVKFGPSVHSIDDSFVGARMQCSRATVRRASAPSVIEQQRRPDAKQTAQTKTSTMQRQYKLRSEPLKSILKNPTPPLPQKQVAPMNPPWMPGPRMVRTADLEVASLSQRGRRRRDDYVGEIGVKAERQRRYSRSPRVSSIQCDDLHLQRQAQIRRQQNI